MLVLSRKANEAIHIGSDVVIRVSSISGNRVKLAIDAPREVAIRRSELELELPELGGPAGEHGLFASA